ncbi:Hypothetical protein PHPALM_5353 [Phytophthora palmivora]|uniref:Retrotransposon gag domain-containing protein n=1 Tax=Phytophthora palmivora TaxID=4796 RepID=A0A2P4YHJ9_9STRA|nr:Hypothetical protein PHPALM_5353 [Phytophthora palmivora]
MRGLRLRKMDVSSPTFDGIIDGIKLNSFVFQFESYFQQKGYSMTHHDHLLLNELNQCVRKNALIWYVRFMTDDTTTKLWSIMKSEMNREFREPNFQIKVRNKLLKMKQTGAYHGYVNKFRVLQRIVGLDELQLIAQMRIAIQRKQPMTLTAAVKEGFLEWELQDNPPQIKRSNNQMKNFSSKSKGGKQKRGFGKTIQHSNSDRNNTITAASSQNYRVHTVNADFPAKMIAGSSILRRNHMAYNESKTSTTRSMRFFLRR